MKINRSTKCSLKFLTTKKKETLLEILHEYSRISNQFIDQFWVHCPKNSELLKPVLDCVDTWLSARMRQCSAREAIGMVKASKERDGDKAVKPIHRGKRMCLSSAMGTVEESKHSTEFDYWLKLSSIGEKIKLYIPLKKHRHFNQLSKAGKMCGHYIITKDYVQFSFEIETGAKTGTKKTRGIDTGIKALASTSDGKQFGLDIQGCINTINRCQQNSKGQKRATERLKQRIGEITKEVIKGCDSIVVENLKGITKNLRDPKRRLGKSMRRTISRWNVRYWLDRLQQRCEWNRVTFRSVNPAYTSQTCSSCGHVDRDSRNGTMFGCTNCDYTCNADINAAKNIVLRLTTGRYGAGFKPLL